MARVRSTLARLDSLLPSSFDGNGHRNGDVDHALGALPQPMRERELDHSAAPYLSALRHYAGRGPGRFHVPGHKGGLGTDPELVDTLGQSALSVDIPLVIPGVDVGQVGVDLAHSPIPLDLAQQMAADAWGAKRTWFLTNGATQGNHAICLALAHRGSKVAVQRNVHASTIDGLVLSGLRPTFVAPELNFELGVAHCVTPQSLEVTLADSPELVAAMVVSPTYFGAVADIRGLAEVAHAWGVPLIVDEAWGAHFPFHEALPEDALSAGADIVLSGTHKLIGSLTQSAMLHLGKNSDLAPSEEVISRAMTLVTSTSPSSLLLGSLDAARRHAEMDGHDCLEEAIAAVAATRAAIRALPGLDVLDERLLSHPGVYDYDPMRLAIDVRGSGVSGYELADVLRERSDVHLELSSNDLLVALFGISEPAAAQGELLVRALKNAMTDLMSPGRVRRREHLPPPPRWGRLAVTPREAFFGPQEIVPFAAAVGRVTVESIAAYPPGIPNALPGERLTADTLEFVRSTLDQGGTVRGLSDPTCDTIRVVADV